MTSKEKNSGSKWPSFAFTVTLLCFSDDFSTFVCFPRANFSFECSSSVVPPFHYNEISTTINFLACPVNFVVAGFDCSLARISLTAKLLIFPVLYSCGFSYSTTFPQQSILLGISFITAVRLPRYYMQLRIFFATAVKRRLRSTYISTNAASRAEEEDRRCCRIKVIALHPPDYHLLVSLYW